ncbi:MAG: rhomboid family intramembrane serine protease [Candidatus Aureabacteria bacterium]|nr:rhomboid family intramembrane serine protease [Candidatus Auribacterota bacterium]
MKKTLPFLFPFFGMPALLLFNLTVTVCWLIASRSPFVSLLMQNHFTLSLIHVKEWRILSVLMYAFSHQTILEFLIVFIPLFLILRKLKFFYSMQEMGFFYINAAVIGGIFHLLMAPENQVIHGAFGITLSFLILLCQVDRNFPLFKLFTVPFNLTTLTFLLVIADLFTIDRSYHPDSSSFSNHLGMFIYTVFYMKKRSLFAPFFRSYSFPPFQIRSGGYSHRPDLNKTETGFPSVDSKNKSPLSPEEEIDRILDKISKYGIDSLTGLERKKLEEASRRK